MIKVEREKLYSAVEMLKDVVSKRPIVPIYGHILIRVEEGEMRLTAASGTMGAHFWIDDIETDGEEVEATVPVKEVHDWLNTQQSSEFVTVIIEGDRVTLSTDKAQANLQSMNTEHFPNVSTKPDGEDIVIGEEDFKRAVGQTIFATVDDIARPMLSSILVQSTDNGKLCFQGADGNRLSATYIEYHGGDFRALVPRETIRVVSRACMGTVRIGWAGGNIVFTSGDWVLSSQTTEQKYPDFSPFTERKEEDVNTIVEIGKGAKNQSRAVMVFAKQNDNLLKVKITADQIILSSYVEVGSGEASFPCFIHKGDELEFMINGAYFVDALKAGDNLSLWIVDETEAVQFVNEDQTFVHFIMPMQLR
jgi:DNA polymerase-3 subunit beta